MAKLVKEIGTGPIGIEKGANTQVTAVINATMVIVCILLGCSIAFAVCFIKSSVLL